MFGKNEIVGKKYFKDASKDQLFVTSMFGPTIQGEGIYRSFPAFFIRLAKCNLNCQFCDTFFDDGDWLDFQQINERIEDVIDSFYERLGMERPDWTKTYIDENGKVIPRRMVLVITGGEPMLQDNINEFLQTQIDSFQWTQIESNGTQNTEIPRETTLVISPKCLEKNGVAIKYLQPRQDILDRADCLKFVIENNPDSPYSTVPEWAHQWSYQTGRPVFVSPMNIYNDIPKNSKNKRATSNQISLNERSTVDEVISFWEPGLLNMEENQKNHEYAAKYCITHGFLLNLQIHLYASLP